MALEFSHHNTTFKFCKVFLCEDTIQVRWKTSQLYVWLDVHIIRDTITDNYENRSIFWRNCLKIKKDDTV